MAGFRVGFCCGNKTIVQALQTIKGYYDYGIFQAVQIASIIALRHGEKYLVEQAKKYEARRNLVCDWLEKMGWGVERPRGTMFVWTRVADEHLRGMSTLDYAMDLLEHAEVVVSPGRGFGEKGEGYLRIALVENEHRLRQAMKQIHRFVQGKPAKRRATGREKA
jgi:alanine-synthesizing transaminase